VSDSEESESDEASQQSDQMVPAPRPGKKASAGAAAMADSPTFAPSPSASLSFQEDGAHAQDTGADSTMFDDDIIELDPAARATSWAPPPAAATRAMWQPTRVPSSPALRPTAPGRTLTPAQTSDVSEELFAMPPTKPIREPQAPSSEPSRTGPARSVGWAEQPRPLQRPRARCPASVRPEAAQRGLHPSVAALLSGDGSPTLLGAMARQRRAGFSALGHLASAPRGPSEGTVVAIQRISAGAMYCRCAASASAPAVRRYLRDRAHRLLVVHTQHSTAVVLDNAGSGAHREFQCSPDAMPCAALQDACLAGANMLQSARELTATAPGLEQSERAAAATCDLVGRLYGWIAPLEAGASGASGNAIDLVQRKRKLSEWLEAAMDDEVSAALQRVRQLLTCMSLSLELCMYRLVLLLNTFGSHQKQTCADA
jgi:hypothetical protein